MGPKRTPSMLEQRIEEVLTRRIFPDAKAWCLAADVSEGYLTTLKRRLRLGQARSGKLPELRKLAKSAGVTLVWLLGEDVDLATSNMGLTDDPSWLDLNESIRATPGLAATLAIRGREWHVRSVVKALEYTEPTFANDAAAMRWWAKLLNAVEKGKVPPRKEEKP